MSLQSYKGEFAANTSTGNQAISGLGFQPKAVLLWTTGQTTAGFSTLNQFSIGYLSAAGQATSTMRDETGVAPACSRYATATKCFALLANSSGPTIDATATFVSLDAGGFTINWDDAPAAAVLIHYLALGGSDITNVKVGSFNLPTAAGVQNLAVTGVGFTPDLLLFQSALPTTAGTAQGGAQISLGAAVSSSQRGACVVASRGGVNPSQVGKWQRADRCLLGFGGANPAANDFMADLASMDADGFTLSLNDGASGTYPVFYMAIEGTGQFHVGSETQKTSTGAKATTGVGFQPSGLLLFSGNTATDTTHDQTIHKLSLGATDGTREGSSWTGSVDAAATANTDRHHSTSKTLVLATNDSTIDAEADLTSFDADGYTLGYTTADATAREFITVAFGSSAAPPVAANPIRRVAHRGLVMR